MQVHLVKVAPMFSGVGRSWYGSVFELRSWSIKWQSMHSLTRPWFAASN